MMDFETWGRDKLIEEVKAVMRTRLQSCSNASEIQQLPNLPTDKELHEKTDPELRSIYLRNKMNDGAFRKKYEENEEQKRYFNQPECDADFNYWSKQPYWSIDEALLLVLGKDPRKVNVASMITHRSVSPLAKKFVELQELARRYVNCCQLSNPVHPSKFLYWAEKMEIKIPNELRENVIRILNPENTNLREKQEQSNEDELMETERQSLYKLIAAMAYDGYGYNPTDRKSSLTTELTNAVLLHIGEKIDPNTTRKWLKAATQAYPKTPAKTD